ncbi:MAG: methionine adenosyltransferase [Aerococcus sp.]|nr:methionine adenosyltransferase [Aerococcus sp.]
MNKHFFTSESVTEGHPDKVADQISDAILDAILAQDPGARVACETVVNTGLVFVFGEVTTSAYVDIQSIVRETIRRIGYTDDLYGFDADHIAVLVSLDEQSPDIALGVDDAYESREAHNGETPEIGAGDQGVMFGYATNETPEMMPMPIALSHRLARRLTAVRKDEILDYLGPDGKTQVTIEYDGDEPKRIDTVVVSAQHHADIPLDQLRKDIQTEVILPTLPKEWIDDQTHFYINPTGKFVIGGPVADSGLTGRKIIVDTYGGTAPHGGGAFSGKDYTKVDRSASYMARYIAKNLVASGLAAKCEIQLAYAIGVAHPVSIAIDTKNTSNYSEEALVQLVRDNFQLTPRGITETLDLKQPIYAQTAAYGHFGRTDIDLPWEHTDKADILREQAEKLTRA